MISLIVAFDENHVIGKDGWMPWNLKEDLQHFRCYTLHKDLLVGRKTFEGFKKPLPHRFHYVLTHAQIEYPYEEVKVIHDIREIVSDYQNSERELVVIGGAQVYQTALPYVDKMVISLVNGQHDGDTFFPDFNEEDFVVEKIEKFNEFSVITLLRKGA